MEVVKKIIDSGAITIRDVDNGEKPFVYSAGNHGPGYIMIKGLCGQPDVMHYLVDKLADKVAKACPQVDFINGNVTGGVVTGWLLRDKLSEKLGRNIPFVYLRGARKRGGHDELITGIHNNSTIKKGMNVVVVEELVNSGMTTINAVDTFRNCGYNVTHVATVLFYNHDFVNVELEKNNINLVSLVTLDELLNVAKDNNLMKSHLVDSYKSFLTNSVKWQLKHGLPLPEDTAKLAEDQGYLMKLMDTETAVTFGAPKSKLEQGVKYYKHMKPTVMVAVDDPQWGLVRNLVDNCEVDNYGFKINLDAVLFDENVLSCFKKFNRPIFVDVKMWNGKRTMSSVVQQCVDNNVSIVNVYAHAGKDVLKHLANIVKGTNTKLFVLTVLTHYTEDYVRELYGKSMEETIRLLASWAEESGCTGVILPAKYLYVVKDMKLLTMCPGIRPDWYANKHANNQVQISTPTEAVKNGANYLVIGSPITKVNTTLIVDQPCVRLNKILNEIDDALK
jgi:orotidine-5'-phosphate decarboxylase